MAFGGREVGIIDNRTDFCELMALFGQIAVGFFKLLHDGYALGAFGFAFATLHAGTGNT